ncbi:peptidase [Ruminococcaceae bacterium OttesenSCG-928-N02]|nr:peptidase [Ruminococcaceae bacterium OttesenSCG-928-N02]
MKSQGRKRIVLLYAGVLAIFVAAALRLYYFQVVNGEHYYTLSDATASDTYTYTAARGEIVDRFGRPLVTNRIGFNVSLNRSYLKDENLNDTLYRLVQILQEAEETWADTLPITTSAPYTFLEGREDKVAALKTMLGLNVYATEQNVLDKIVQRYGLEGYPPAWQRILGGIRYEMELREYGYSVAFTLSQDISIKTVSIIKENSATFLGVDIVEESIRDYPDGTLAPHILGTVGPIYAEEYAQLKTEGYSMNATIGKDGIEKTYESDLRGTDGLLQITRSNTGEILSSEVVQEAVPGRTVVLTIDKDIQAAAQRSLEEMIIQYQTTAASGRGREADAGSVVVIDMRTGGILAAANYPSYDLNYYISNYNEYASNPAKPLFNRALQGVYRPGSTFKPVVATAGLMTGEIDASSTVYCSGTYGFWASTHFAPGCTGVHRNVNVERALGVSCNIFFYDVGRRIGLNAFNEIAKLYGLGEATGIELPEQTGSLTYPGDDWQAGNVVQAAIGQMDTMVTPLQLASYAATIGNNGTRYATHIVQAVRSYDYEHTYSESQPQILSQIEASDEVFATVERGMRQAALQYSSLTNLGNYPLEIVTKTGTAQAGGGYYNALIIAYGPTDNPEIAIAIIVEKGFDSYHLSKVIKDIFDAYYFSNSEGVQIQQSGVLL